MINYTESQIKLKDKMLVTNKTEVKAVFDDKPKSDEKSIKRARINEEVFSIEDSVADNAKMISLLITLCDRLYNTFDDDQKNKLSDDDRDLIEYVFSSFKECDTRADIQLAKDGTDMIDNIFNSQSKVGEILK